MTTWIQNDGGREAAGFKGHTGDCVTRAVAIASGRPYREVYDRLAEIHAAYRGRRVRKSARGQRTARAGIPTQSKAFKAYMAELGFVWVPTMTIGSGCKVHLRADELPNGKLVAMLSRHACAIINGVIHDTYDPAREGSRCVCGYYQIQS